MQFKVTKQDKDNIKMKLQELPHKLDLLRLHVGNTLADNIKADVIKRIPKGSSWLDIYRKSINISFDGQEWVVAGEKELAISAVDATQTLVFFGNEDKASAVLIGYNPWPVDIIPALDVIHTSKVVMRPASKSEVETRRNILETKMESIKNKIKAAGFNIIPGELPKFGGNTVADLSFLAQRLENGIFFPRTPVWRAVSDNMGNLFKKSIKESEERFNSILRNPRKTRHAPSTKLRGMLASAIRR